MNTAELSLRLRGMSTSRLKLLASLAGVGERTLWKIRAGTTKSASEVTKGRIAAGLKRLPRKRA
jgi:hypothetical protein